MYVFCVEITTFRTYNVTVIVYITGQETLDVMNKNVFADSKADYCKTNLLLSRMK